MIKLILTKLILPMVLFLVVVGGISVVYTVESDQYQKGKANYSLSYIYSVQNAGNINLTSLDIRLAVLKSWHLIQEVKDLKIYTQPNTTSTDSYNNTYAHYNFDGFDIGQSMEFRFDANLTVNLLDFSNYDFKNTQYNKSSHDYLQFTTYDYLTDPTDLRIQEKASELIGSNRNPIDIAFQFYNFTSVYLKYRLLGSSRGAGFALAQGYGDCDEYQNLFIALSQAAGIPAVGHTAWFADFVPGLEIDDQGAVAHAYPMFLDPELGLLPVDPTRGAKQLYENWLKTDEKRITLTRGPDHPYRHIQYKWVPSDTGENPNIVSSYKIKIHDLKIEYTSMLRRLILISLIAIPIVFSVFNIFKFRANKQYQKEKLAKILDPSSQSKE